MIGHAHTHTPMLLSENRGASVDFVMNLTCGPYAKTHVKEARKQETRIHSTRGDTLVLCTT